MVWACDAKRGALCGKDGDGAIDTRKKEDKKVHKNMRGHCEG